MLRWAAVCWRGLTGPVSILEPWRDWPPPHLQGFYKWVFGTLEELNLFVSRVVIARKGGSLDFLEAVESTPSLLVCGSCLNSQIGGGHW